MYGPPSKDSPCTSNAEARPPSREEASNKRTRIQKRQAEQPLQDLQLPRRRSPQFSPPQGSPLANSTVLTHQCSEAMRCVGQLSNSSIMRRAVVSSYTGIPKASTATFFPFF